MPRSVRAFFSAAAPESVAMIRLFPGSQGSSRSRNGEPAKSARALARARVVFPVL
jgi:hypothetical protein